MNPDTLDCTLNFIAKYHCPDRTLRITFYGGEALLALETMKTFIENLKSRITTKIEFGISTNGYLLSPEVVDWICSLPVCRVYVSLDGDRSTHDANRMTADGRPTYNKILENLKYFAEKYPVRYNDSVDFLVTLSSYNELVRVSDFMKSDSFLCNKTPIHLSFILPRNADERKLSNSRYADFKTMLETAYSRYRQGEESLLVRKFIEWTDIFDASRSEKITVTTCAEDMYRLFISTDGHVYLCERLNQQFTLGTVNDEFHSIIAKSVKLERQFIDRRNKLCRHCDVASWCTMCMTSLNYSDNELAELCSKERAILTTVKEYAYRRRFDLN